MKLQLTPQKSTRVLVAIDLTIEGAQTLINSLDPAAAIILDPKRNGIEQITTALSNCTAVDDLQIIAPYCPGAIQLGSIWLDRSGLETHIQQLQIWRQSFIPETKILLHGSQVAMGVEGMAFVGRLSQLTGALVIASHALDTLVLDNI